MVLFFGSEKQTSFHQVKLFQAKQEVSTLTMAPQLQKSMQKGGGGAARVVAGAQEAEQVITNQEVGVSVLG